MPTGDRLPCLSGGNSSIDWRERSDASFCIATASAHCRLQICTTGLPDGDSLVQPPGNSWWVLTADRRRLTASDSGRRSAVATSHRLPESCTSTASEYFMMGRTGGPRGRPCPANSSNKLGRGTRSMGHMMPTVLQSKILMAQRRPQSAARCHQAGVRYGRHSQRRPYRG